MCRILGTKTPQWFSIPQSLQDQHYVGLDGVFPVGDRQDMLIIVLQFSQCQVAQTCPPCGVKTGRIPVCLPAEMRQDVFLFFGRERVPVAGIEQTARIQPTQLFSRRPAVYAEPGHEIAERLHKFAVKSGNEGKHALQQQTIIQETRYVSRREKTRQSAGGQETRRPSEVPKKSLVCSTGNC